MRKFRAVGVSFPFDMLEKIDKARGDVGRSRFIMRIVEAYFQEKKK